MKSVPVHGHTTDMGATSEPTATPGLSEVAVLPEGVADFSDGGDTVLQDLAHLTTLQTDMGVPAGIFVRDDLAEGSRRANEECTALGVERDVVDDSPGRDEAQGNDIAGLDSEGAKNTEGKRSGGRRLRLSTFRRCLY